MMVGGVLLTFIISDSGNEAGDGNLTTGNIGSQNHMAGNQVHHNLDISNIGIDDNHVNERTGAVITISNPTAAPTITQKPECGWWYALMFSPPVTLPFCKGTPLLCRGSCDNLGTCSHCKRRITNPDKWDKYLETDCFV